MIFCIAIRCTSFESLFGLLKAEQCPYFYVCSHQTTVLFRRRDGVLCADLVPTTYGVRNSLKQEGKVTKAQFHCSETFKPGPPWNRYFYQNTEALLVRKMNRSFYCNWNFLQNSGNMLVREFSGPIF